jgi:hypothetical protein
MKFLLKLLVAIAFIELSAAIHGLSKDGFVNKKYQLNKEPPLNSDVVLSANETAEEKWIEQRLNNFDPLDNRTWQMRYYENSFHLEDGGPIFVYIGGEWTISTGWVLGGHPYDMMRELNGILFYTEHRYYGESRPVSNLTIDNLRFLNVDQALADLAHFIVHIKQTIPEVRNSGVILVGGSYSATMATWFMQKYPHLANGAWSSSAPLEAKVDFVEYKEVVSESIEIVGGENCTRRIRNAFEELEKLIAENNTRRIEEVFHLCHPLNLNNDLDVWSFVSDMAGPWSGIVQYHSERDQDVQSQCEILVNNDIESDIEALSHWWWFESIDQEDPGFYCYDHRYETALYYFTGTSWESRAARDSYRQWLYQTCAEYGWYQSSGSDDILFGSLFPVDLTLQLCHDAYTDA